MIFLVYTLSQLIFIIFSEMRLPTYKMKTLYNNID